MRGLGRFFAWAWMLLLLQTLLPLAGQAHEVRPALLLLVEDSASPGSFDVLWRVPARGEMVLSLEPRFPPACSRRDAAADLLDGTRFEQKFQLVCSSSLQGAVISIEGLQAVQTDVLVRVEYASGATETLVAAPSSPSVTLNGPSEGGAVAGAYFVLGMEHILLGFDHLLFVAGLMLLVSGWRRLVGTVTAFTLAHSVTLAGATLGFISAPPPLIEALIALSILFVAVEALHRWQGRQTFAVRRPWTIAFGFGLLHGFGFAGALSQIGLPQDAIPLSLLFFNLGVEAGQLLFIAALFSALWSLRRLGAREPAWGRTACAYAIGGLAAFWVLERVAAWGA